MNKIVIGMMVGLLTLAAARSGFATTESQALVKDGRALLLKNGVPTFSGVIAANTKFQSAVLSDPTDQQAHYFFAVTKVLSSLAQNSKAGNETICDLLKSFGVKRNASNILDETGFSSPAQGNGKYNPPTTIPTGKALQAYLVGPFVDLLDEALDDLAVITNAPQAFSIVLTAKETGDLPIDIDYGDVLVMKSALYTAKAFVLLMNAWNLDIDLRKVIVQGNTGVLQLQRDLLGKYKSLLHLKPGGDAIMDDSQTALFAAIDAYRSAFNFITKQPSPLHNDLFAFDFATPEEQASALEDLNTLTEVQNSLKGNRPAILGLDKDKVDFNYLFGNVGKSALDFRSAIPALNSNDLVIAESSISKPILGGLFPEITTKEAMLEWLGDAVTYAAPKSITVPASTNNASYIVRWTSNPLDTKNYTLSYTLEEADNKAFNNSRQVYSGEGKQVTLTDRPKKKTYYYRVKTTKTGATDSNWLTAKNGCRVL